jgi:Cft2 family RNA processing exonuclease
MMSELTGLRGFSRKSGGMTGWATVATKSLTTGVCRNYNKRMISWDEPKRKRNLKDHGIDLAEVAGVFDFPMVTVEDERER